MRVDQLYEPMFDILADEIDRTAKSNKARYRYAEFMSHNNWTNTEFNQLVEDALGFLALEIDRYDRRTRDEEILADIASRWITMDLSAWVLNNKELADELDDETYNGTKAAARERDLILRDIERASSRGASRGREPVDRRGMVRGGGGRERGGRVERERPRGGSLFRDNGSDRQESGSRRASGMAAVTAREEREERRDEEVTSRRREPEARRQEPVEERYTPPATERGRGRPKTAPDGPDFTKSKPYDEFWIADELWRPAHKSGWEVTWEVGMPFPIAFNPSLYMRFHVQSEDGRVREEFLAMTRDMDYLRHELVGTTDRGVPVEQPRYSREETPGEGYPSPVTPKIQEHAQVVVLASAPLDEVYPDLVTHGNLEEAEINAEFERQKKSLPVGAYSFTLAKPISADIHRAGVLAGLSNAGNLTDAAEQLQAAVGKADLSEWNFVNDRFTMAVNDAVRHMFALKAEITDFANDYKSLLEWMRSKKGDMFARNFSQRTRFIVQQAASRLPDPGARTYITGCMDITEEEYDLKPPSVLVYQEYFTVLVAPFGSHELGVKVLPTSQMVDIDATPKLFQLVENLHQLATRTLEGCRPYILTRDRMRIEVLQSGLDNMSYLIRRL